MTDDEKWPIKTQNVKVSVIVSLLIKGSASTRVVATLVSFYSHEERRRGESGDTRSVMRLHRGAGTHQTPTEADTDRPKLHSRRNERLKDSQDFTVSNQKLSSSSLSSIYRLSTCSYIKAENSLLVVFDSPFLRHGSMCDRLQSHP